MPDKEGGGAAAGLGHGVAGAGAGADVAWWLWGLELVAGEVVALAPLLLVRALCHGYLLHSPPCHWNHQPPIVSHFHITVQRWAIATAVTPIHSWARQRAVTPPPTARRRVCDSEHICLSLFIFALSGWAIRLFSLFSSVAKQTCTIHREAGLFLRSPFTERCDGVNDQTLPPGRSNVLYF